MATLTTDVVDFVFEGRFENRQVTWHCQLNSLASIAQLSRRPSQRQFIEILPQDNSQAADKPVLQIRVGLNVPEITPDVIEKTIIMIRNYKRLQMGRYEYGECFEYTLD